jgi:hypothetical protein
MDISPRAFLSTLAVLLLLGGTELLAQEHLIFRTPPPPVEDFETDSDKDGIPDGWYNLRDATLVKGGKVGPTCLRFENAKRGRPARASRAFGIDGKKNEAIIIGLWIRAEGILQGERSGEQPTLMIDFLGENIKGVRRDTIGPWMKTPNASWVRVAERIPIPETTRDAIMTLGLLGATGVLDIDGMTFEVVPRGGVPTTNLVLNGDFELGGVTQPKHWFVEDGARRVFPGFQSASAVELTRDGSKALVGLARPATRFDALELQVRAKGVGLRASGGALAEVYFLDSDGRQLSGPDAGTRIAKFSGTFDWTLVQGEVPVPQTARWAVLQFVKTDSAGHLRIDNVEVFASPRPAQGSWTPYQIQTENEDWPAFSPSDHIEAGSALDASAILPTPAGAQGFVTVKDGRLHFEKGGRARFFGVVLLPPLAFADPEKSDALADRLARSGVNLVRFDELDAAFGPNRALFDDSRDDTRVLDDEALGRFDHLVAALKKRGIYISLELQAARVFRDGDGLESPAAFPAGGGPSLAFSQRMKEAALETAKQFLSHVNPETKLALKDDPVLAWVVISGEQSLFNLLDDRDSLPAAEAAELKKLSEKSSLGSGRRLWHSLEASQWKTMAESLRTLGVRVPIAGCSHWRRELDFNSAQATAGLDLVDDRLYWTYPTFGDPERRSMLWPSANGMKADAAKKRKTDRPYVVGQWCAKIGEAWALPFEGADLLLTAYLASTEDWDAIARRGVFLYPKTWGADATGTGGEEDIFAVPEAVNGIPHVFALLPHAASILRHAPQKAAAGRPAARAHGGLWDAKNGRLVIDTPHTVALAGWSGSRPATAEGVSMKIDSSYGALAVSSFGVEPIGTSKRLLVTLIGRVEPTGMRWADEERRDPAEPGTSPLRMEPVHAAIILRRAGKVQAFRLDNNGKRIGPAAVEKSSEAWKLVLKGDDGTVHWELAIE